MRPHMTVLALAALCALGITSCSDSGGGVDAGDTTPPTVVSRSVSNGQTGVGLLTEFSVTFSEALDPATVDSASVFVSGRGPTPHLSYDPGTRTLSLFPDTLFASQTWHEFVLTDSITDLAGNPLSSDTTDFQTGPLDCAHLADRFEPNETVAQAVHVEVGREYPALSICGPDTDVFSFTVTDTVKVHFKTRLRTGASSMSWVTQLLRGVGEYYSQIGYGASPGGTYDHRFTFLPGTYYADVADGAPSDYVLYDLIIETSAPCEDDPFEDNDFLDETAPLALGHHEGLRGCEIDQDFFSFDAVAGQTITVTAVQLPPMEWAHSRIIIYGPSHGIANQADSDATTHTLSAFASASGTHYVSVRFWSDVGYTLDLDVHD